MKFTAFFLLSFLFASEFCQVFSNVPKSNDGVFQGFKNFHQGSGINQNRPPSTVFEKVDGSVDSNVFDINGMEQFERIIIKNSYYKPVVLKLYLPTQKNTTQVNSIFQDVAQSFNNSIVFAGLNVLNNMQLYMRIYSFCNLKNVELPLFLFYEKGQLKMPFLTGLQHKDYFVEYIQKMFFSANN